MRMMNRFRRKEQLEERRVHPKDRGVLNGKRFWSGVVSLLDGWIEEVRSYEEAERAGFMHPLYFSKASNERMDRGESAFFWIEDGEVKGFWRQRIPKDIMYNIEKQIEILPEEISA